MSTRTSVNTLTTDLTGDAEQDDKQPITSAAVLAGIHYLFAADGSLLNGDLFMR